MPVVKICCIRDTDEASMAIAHGASALGLVSEMPSGPGVIDERAIAEIAAWAPRGVETFLLTSLREVERIIDQHRRLRTTTIQLVDSLTGGSHRDLRSALPGVRIVQVIHVTGDDSIAEAIRLDGEVDAILLDSGNQSAPVRELGGTGRVHDWAISRRIVESVRAPVFLAGGLSAANVRTAIDSVAPYGLDLCSGVRTDGRLDEAKLKAFFEAILWI